MIVKYAIKHAPLPFNVQSCRAAVPFGAEHEKLWDIGARTMRASLPAEVFEKYETKIEGFKRGRVGLRCSLRIQTLSKSFLLPLQDLMGKHPEWYELSSGMNQFIIWTALCTQGLGCNLQHFQPTISAEVAKTWDVPETWTLRAQLVFGTPTGPPTAGIEKNFALLEGTREGF